MYRIIVTVGFVALGLTNAMDAAIEARFEALELENAAMKQQLASAQDAAAGELRLFHQEACPAGWQEFNRTQGYLLTGRPRGAAPGKQLNRPLTDGELGRAPEHSHTATVTDAGHTHLTEVNDPGRRWR
jgi:hypothetical protein